MNKSKIEWTDKTWNPATGCSKVSTGCKNCYAEIMANRLHAMGVAKYVNGFTPVIHEETLEEPLTWKKPHNIFVCSMADLFHEEISFEFIDKVMSTIKKASHHRFQILTKRTKRMAEYFTSTDIPENVWLGTTVESPTEKYRIDILRNLKASILFLSCEPLVEDLGTIDLTNIDWLIVGGESGGRARPMKADWVRCLLKQADEQKTAFFFKQWGTWGSDGVKRNKKANGKILDGKILQEMPHLEMR